MKIIYGKELTSEQNSIVTEMANQCGILFDTARLLFYRGIDSIDKAKAFLNPGKHGFINPFKLNGMQAAVNRITQAKEQNQSVLIFGDYDADGICATTVLYFCLKEFGITARLTVPEREEGYGLNVNKVKELSSQEKIDLLITVDCGISDYDKIEQIKAFGIDVIVTDHHEPPEILPKTVCINPKIAGQSYGFTELCGAGVAYKLGNALIGEAADKYLDFVCLATVADSMDLTGENRDITVEGFKIFNDKKTLRKPFKLLLGDTHREINSQTLSYAIAPRVNAGGRMGDAAAALRLFIQTDENKIFDLAAKLSEYNVARQLECDKIYHQAKNKIIEQKLTEKDVILVADDNWKAGFVGIVAAKLVEEFSRPVIVFAGHDGYYKGSARSVEGFNIHDAITATKDLLIAFGGHSQAAGVSVSKENYAQLDFALNEYVRQNGINIDVTQKIFAEWNVDKPISLRFAKEIEYLEPFGIGNRRPIFSVTVGAVNSLPLKSGSPHYSFKTPVLEMLEFNGEKHVQPLALPVDKKIVFEINLSNYKGRESVKGYVRNVCPEYGDFSTVRLHIFNNETTRLLNDCEVVVDELETAQLCSSKRALYLVSDPDNIKEYPELSSLPLSLFTPSGSGSEIIVSPIAIPNGYDRVIYLDKPMQYLDNKGKSYRLKNLIGYKTIDGLNTDRGEFARIFSKLVAISGRAFKDCVNFVISNLADEDLYQALFVVKVFLELNIFKIEKGRFIYDQKVKNALTNSKLYSKIYSLKG